MKRTERELPRIYRECMQIMRGVGYDVKEVPITLNGRLTRVLGRYFRVENRIELSKNFFLYASEEAVKNTIIHEICHQVSPTRGHGADWKQIAQRVSSKTPYNITRLASNDKVEGVPKIQKERKYLIKCSHCGQEYRYVKKVKAYTSPQDYSCGKCKKSNTLIPM